MSGYDNEIRKKDASNMTYEELIAWAEEEAKHLYSPYKSRTVTNAPKSEEELTIMDIGDKCMGDSVEVEIPAPRVVNNGKGIMVDDEHVDKHRKPTVKNKGIVIEENQNPTSMDETSSDSERDYSNKSVDYISEGEDEVIELKT
ncbi:hypothetical protein Tco_1272622 [Tanacetum coccineum]